MSVINPNPISPLFWSKWHHNKSVVARHRSYEYIGDDPVGEYYLWPSLGLAIKRKSKKGFTYARSIFSSGKKGLISAGLHKEISWFLAPYFCRLPHQEDVLLLSNALVAIDLDNKSVRKFYSLPLADYVQTHLRVLETAKMDWSVSRRETWIKVSCPLYPGVPMNALPRRNRGQIWELFEVALKAARAPFGSGDETFEPASQYLLNLQRGSPVMAEDPMAARLLRWLETRSDWKIPVTTSHGDLKPENIIADGTTCRLIDWELADRRSAWHDLLNLVIHPIVAGTLEYGNLRQEIAVAVLCGSHQGLDLSKPDDLARAFAIVLLEKHALYFGTERWAGARKNTLRDWTRAVRIISGHLGIGDNDA